MIIKATTFPSFVLFVLLTFSLIFTASASVQFNTNEQQFTLRADWLQDSKDLDQYVPEYNQFISKESAKRLTLSFAYCPSPEYIISRFFSKQIKVESLLVNLDTCKIQDSGLKKILKHINEKTTKQLHLMLGSSGISASAGAILGSKTASLKLRSLKIGMMMNKIGNKGLSDFFMNPANEQLQDLSLDLTTNKLGLEAFSNFSYYLSKVPANRLFRVELLVHGNRIESNGTWDISRALKKFTNIQVLRFDGYFNHIKTQGVKPISLLVQKMRGLRQLSLNFDLNFIQNQGGRLLGSSLHHLVELQSLQIGVSTKNFGYNGYDHIINGIMNLKKLKHLNFRCGVNRIGPKGGKALKTLLSKLPELKYLELHLHENAMYGQGLAHITEAIQRLSGLKTLVLNFGFNELKGQSILSLLKALSKKQINNVWLGLSSNPLEDSDIKPVIPFIKEIIKGSSKFQLELLYTKIGANLAKELREGLLTEGRSVTVHVNSEEEVKDVQEEINRGDEEQRKRQQQSEL